MSNDYLRREQRDWCVDETCQSSFIYIMFEKIKKFGGKATDSVIEGAKETLNDRMDKYSDIIQIGLVTLVIAWSGNKLLGHGKKQQPQSGCLPQGYDFGSGSPIVINNYYSQNPYRNQKHEKGAYYGRSGKNSQKR